MKGTFKAKKNNKKKTNKKNKQTYKIQNKKKKNETGYEIFIQIDRCIKGE